VENKYSGYVELDYSDRVIINKDRKLVGQYILRDIYFISSVSFRQNNKIMMKNIDKKVQYYLDTIHDNIHDNMYNMVMIGGSSYYYSFNRQYKSRHFYANRESSLLDCKVNSDIYCHNNMMNINYIKNKVYDHDYEDNTILLINLRKLDDTLIESINNNYKKIKYIISIFCKIPEHNKFQIMLPHHKPIKIKSYIDHHTKQLFSVSLFILS
jgi:c-di-AMP phosphodiesterase-like protein